MAENSLQKDWILTSGYQSYTSAYLFAYLVLWKSATQCGELPAASSWAHPYRSAPSSVSPEWGAGKGKRSSPGRSTVRWEDCKRSIKIRAQVLRGHKSAQVLPSQGAGCGWAEDEYCLLTAQSLCVEDFQERLLRAIKASWSARNNDGLLSSCAHKHLLPQRVEVRGRWPPQLTEDGCRFWRQHLQTVYWGAGCRFWRQQLQSVYWGARWPPHIIAGPLASWSVLMNPMLPQAGKELGHPHPLQAIWLSLVSFSLSLVLTMKPVCSWAAEAVPQPGTVACSCPLSSARPGTTSVSQQLSYSSTYCSGIKIL